MSLLVRRLVLPPLAMLFLLASATVVGAQTATADKAAFFENKIRPVLVEACYSCHNSVERAEGGLALDAREALLKGGERGAAIVAGKANESLLIRAIAHQQDDLRMPAEGGKLKPAVLADFVRWIDDGAFDPRDKPPTAADLAQATSWEQTRARRRAWWSFQPIQIPPLPTVDDPRWQTHPVDRFVRARQAAAKISPAAPAEPAVLLRRVTLLLTGVPPTIAEADAFLADPSPQAYRDVVDRLLQSPRFGERWARHWMDWFRYADSHGSEGDPAIPHAWKYRDYLIRALNADVPCDQLVREHIAGDLLPQPRIDAAAGIRESALGIGHFRMVQHGYAPTDALDEQVRFTDNQIDVLSKAFLGLTVSCARCHHHKFDPISQEDFYALYGIFASCRPGTITVDTPERAATNQQQLQALKSKLKPQLVAAWKQQAGSLDKQLRDKRWQPQLAAAAANPQHPLHAYATINAADDAGLADAWQKQTQAFAQQSEAFDRYRQFDYPLHWRLDDPEDYAQWFRSGNGLLERPTSAGEFTIAAEGPAIVEQVLPAGVFTNRLSTKHNGVLTSPRFRLDCDEIWVRIAGGNNARVRYVVQNYPRVVLIYPHTQIETATERWFHWDARYWKGEQAYIEIVTGDDQPIDVGSQDGRSWFGILEVIGRNHDQPAPSDPPGGLLSVLSVEERVPAPQTKEDLNALYSEALANCIKAWEQDQLSDSQAAFLNYFVQQQLLPNQSAAVPDVAALVQEYRQLEAAIPLPTRAAGIHEAEPFNQPLFRRGEHRQPGAEVPRRFLEVFDQRPFTGPGSGRLELAQRLSDPHNPLVPRVLVNRLWHHLFGQGLVTTTDNFGLLADEPVQQELLDYLAGNFAGLQSQEPPPFRAWSLQDLLRHLLLSQTFQQASRGHAEAVTKDPANQLWTRFPVRRLEAEAIRDSILATTVGLDETQGGPSVAGNSQRRSVYVRVQRNNLDPLLTAFDMPEPATTRGTRDTTNVPAQSLALLNDPFLTDLAKKWGQRVVQDGRFTSDEMRVQAMLQATVGRKPSAQEVRLALNFLNASAEEQQATARQLALLQGQIDSHRQQIQAVLTPARQQLIKQRVKPDAVAGAPQPMARWAFESDLQDSVGELHAQFQGPKGEKTKPAFRDGALILDGSHFAMTPILKEAIAAKTFEAWVQLETVDQQGGAVLSLEAPNGSVFDALVFGEKDPRQWMAGSDFFRRTQSVGGEAEAITTEPVHVAVVYAADGTITLYRAGKLYGKPYNSGALVKFPAEQSQLLFGLRHGPPAPGRFLTGQIFEARFYARALTADEIAASAAGGEFLSQDQILAALSAEDREKVSEWEAAIQELQSAMKQLAPADWDADPLRKWQDLAQSLLSWKEFLYVY